MQHDPDACARSPAHFQIADVAFDVRVAAPRVGPDIPLNLVQIAASTRGVVVEADDLLPQVEQAFEQIRADESRYTRDEPSLRVFLQRFPDFLVARAHCNDFCGCREITTASTSAPEALT